MFGTHIAQPAQINTMLYGHIILMLASHKNASIYLKLILQRTQEIFQFLSSLKIKLIQLELNNAGIMIKNLFYLTYS